MTIYIANRNNTNVFVVVWYAGDEIAPLLHILGRQSWA